MSLLPPPSSVRILSASWSVILISAPPTVAVPFVLAPTQAAKSVQLRIAPPSEPTFIILPASVISKTSYTSTL